MAFSEALAERKEDLERLIVELLEAMRSGKNLHRAMPLLDEREPELAQVSHELEQERVEGGRLMAPVGWGKTTLLATLWGVAGTVCNILLWVFWIGPSAVAPGYFLCLLVPPCLGAVLSGYIHRSQRVGVLAGLLAIALSVLTFLLLLFLALNIHVNP